MSRPLMLFLGLLFSFGAYVHKPSDSYLSFSAEGQEISGQWDIELYDPDFAIGLDANGDAEIT